MPYLNGRIARLEERLNPLPRVEIRAVLVGPDQATPGEDIIRARLLAPPDTDWSPRETDLRCGDDTA